MAANVRVGVVDVRNGLRLFQIGRNVEGKMLDPPHIDLDKAEKIISTPEESTNPSTSLRQLQLN